MRCQSRFFISQLQNFSCWICHSRLTWWPFQIHKWNLPHFSPPASPISSIPIIGFVSDSFTPPSALLPLPILISPSPTPLVQLSSPSLFQNLLTIFHFLLLMTLFTPPSGASLALHCLLPSLTLLISLLLYFSPSPSPIYSLSTIEPHSPTLSPTPYLPSPTSTPPPTTTFVSLSTFNQFYNLLNL